MTSTDSNFSFSICGLDYNWQPEQGTFDAMGTPCALFWLDPSLISILRPLADQIGHSLFRLQVAASASKGSKQEYETIVMVLGDTFEEGFLNWGTAVGSAGWGSFEILSFNPEQATARVRVRNTWELKMQKNLPQRWGCPYIQGKIIGIFSQALNTNCWADEVVVSYDPKDLYIEFDIYPSNKTIATEIAREKRLAIEQKERALAIEIDNKTQLLTLEKIKAEAASHAKSKFLRAIGHELRTPLNAVLDFSQLLATSSNDPLNESQQKDIRQIFDSGNTMLSLVNNILLFAKVGQEIKDVVLQAIQPKDTIAQLLKIMQPMAQTHAITLIDKTPQNIPLVIAHQGYLQEILSSFLMNAITYIPPQGIVTLLIESPTPGLLRLVVQDDGPGIEAHHHANLFEAFERLEHDSGPISGAGLGLSIAKMMAQHIQGTVGFSNNLDAGARFWIELPLDM